MLNRRNFLASFAAACTLDPDRLLWVKSAKTISIARPTTPFSTGRVVSYDIYRSGIGHVGTMVKITNIPAGSIAVYLNGTYSITGTVPAI